MAWNRPSENANGKGAARRSAPTPPHIKGLIAGGIVVIGAGLAAWLILGTKEAKPVGADLRAARPSVIQQTNAVAAVSSPVPKPIKEPEKKSVPEKPPYVKKPGQMQLPSGKILTFRPPREGETRKVYSMGHTYECDHLGNFKDITPRKLFHTAFELNFLGLAQEGKPYIPAFLTGLDEAAVKKMLLKDYVPLGDETPEEKEALKSYDNMRCAALAYMEQGGRFDDFVQEYASFDRKQREYRAMSTREVMMLYRQGKVEEAKEMARTANALMEKKGFKPIHLPARVQQDFDQMPDPQ